MKLKFIALLTILFTGALAGAQDVQYNYDRETDFASYKTYQWVEASARTQSDQLLDHDIRRAIDSQLATKTLKSVTSGGELYVSYYTAVDQEKQLTAWGMGPRWSAMARANTATIDIGKLVIEIFDPAKRQVVWRGSVSKEINISKDPDKNYRKLEKSVARLLQNYPPKAKKN